VESSRGYRPRQTTAGELAINWYTILNITFLPLRTFLPDISNEYAVD